MRRSITVLAVGLLVVLAGCSGLPGGDSTSQQLPDDVKDTHKSALQDAESYNMTYSVSQTQAANDQEQTRDISGQYKVVAGGDRALEKMAFGSGVTAKYTNETATFMQLKMNESVAAEDAVYQTSSAPYNDSGVQPVNLTKATNADILMLENVTYESTGTKTFDGDEVTVYEADSTATEDALQKQLEQSGQSNAEVKNFTAQIYLDENGIVRYHTWSFTIEGEKASLTYDVEMEVTGVGSTTLEAPSWVSVATEQAQNSTASGSA